MAYVTKIGQSFTLATLISERCRALGLSQAEFVNRVGHQDVQKGIRLLHQLFDGDQTRTAALIEAISGVLDLPESVVGRAAQVSQHLLAERQRRNFELEETTKHVDKRAGSVIPYLRLICD